MVLQVSEFSGRYKRLSRSKCSKVHYQNYKDQFHIYKFGDFTDLGNHMSKVNLFLKRLKQL